MSTWANQIKMWKKEKREISSEEVSVTMIVANNHYAGFGPGTVNIFRNMVGQTELSWQDQEHIQRQIQQGKQLEKEQQFSFSNLHFRQEIKRSSHRRLIQPEIYCHLIQIERLNYRLG